MRLKAEIHVESEQYVDLLPPIDVETVIPGVGDELEIEGVSYTCSRRRFTYDAAGKLRGVAIFLKRSAR